MSNRKFSDFCLELFGLRFSTYKELHDWLVINKAKDIRLKILIAIVSDYIYYLDKYHSTIDDGLLRVKVESTGLNFEEGASTLYWLRTIGFKIYNHGVDVDRNEFWIEVSVPVLDVSEDYSNVPEFINFIINKFGGREISWVTSFAVSKFLTWFINGEDITTDELCDNSEYSIIEYDIDNNGNVSLNKDYPNLNRLEDMFYYELKETISKYIEVGTGELMTNVQWYECTELNYFRYLLNSMLSYVGATSESETMHKVSTHVMQAEDCDYIDDDDDRNIVEYKVIETYKPRFIV